METPDYVRLEDLNLYTRLLQELKARMDIAGLGLETKPLTRAYSDLIAVEIRIVLQLLLLGSLITNRAEVEKVTTALHKHSHEDARKLVKRVNPDYWPKPKRQVVVAPGRFKLEDVTEGFLTASDWGPAYGFVSDRIHATNPYAKTPYIAEPLEPVYERMGEIHRQIVALTNHHWIQPVDREFALIGMMQGEDGDVHVTLFQRATEEQQAELEAK